MLIDIRPETPADITAIDKVTQAAFLHAPHTSHTEHRIVDALRAAGRLSVSLVAVDREQEAVIGHVAASPVVFSGGEHGWYGLGPVSVAPTQQGQGIGTRLVEQALAALRAMSAAGCVVLGDPGYYGRFGFRAEASLVLPGVPPEYFQALAFSGAVPPGMVSYDAAFDVSA